jgi:TRAP-type transport system small permease protein
MAKIQKVILWLSEKINWVALLGIAVMMVLTTVDVAGRYFFNKPVRGAFDATGLIGLVIVVAALANAQTLRSHIAVDFITRKLNPKAASSILSLVYFISFILFALIAWQAILYGYSLQKVNETSLTVKIPLAPFVYAISVGCITLCLVLIIDFMRSIKGVFKK